ncbi:MAG: thiolase family protein [Deltaproteobacteria bacterium]|nr:thiolase family protein [Deltaproteobacteria bacterium]
MGDVCVIGVGMTRFGKFPERTLTDLALEALLNAGRDAGVDLKRIQAAFVGHVRQAGQGAMLGQRIMRDIGVTGIPVLNVENICSSGSSAVWCARGLISSGQFDLVAVVGVEQLSILGKGVIPPRREDLEGLQGMTLPAYFAMVARRHMYEYGTTLEQLAKVSVKNHKNGCLNPYAQYRREITLEEIENSAMVADPLTVLHCSPTGDGAAAAIICSEKVARKYTATPVRIAASVLTSGTYNGNWRDLTTNDQTKRAAGQAYETSGIGPEDLDLIELHDCFTIAEVTHYENLGLCRQGDGGALIDQGATELTGKIPVNPSGGLLAKGHPLGATGVAQIVEIVWQLRGEAGDRQVPGARTGLAHCLGGVIDGLDLGACTVHILKK